MTLQQFKYRTCIICDKKHSKCVCDSKIKHLMEWMNTGADEDKHPEIVIDNIIQPYGRGYHDAVYDIFRKYLEMSKNV